MTSLYAIVHTEIRGDKNADDEIELKHISQRDFEILLDFHNNIMPAPEDLRIARKIGDDYSCDRLLAYCDQQLHPEAFTRELRQLSNMIAARSFDEKFTHRFGIVGTGWDDLPHNRITEEVNNASKELTGTISYIIEEIETFEALTVLKADKNVITSGVFERLASAKENLQEILQETNAIIAKESVRALDKVQDLNKQRTAVHCECQNWGLLCSVGNSFDRKLNFKNAFAAVLQMK